MEDDIATDAACTQCGYVSTSAVASCPRCGGPTRQRRVFRVSTATARAVALAPSIIAIGHFAPSWFADALHEARTGGDGDIHARRREILFAVCCAESYLYEWTYALLYAAGLEAHREIEIYFPSDPK